MNFVAYLVPALFLSLFAYAALRRVKLYDTFLDGVKEALPLVVRIFPYLAVIFLLTALFERSGLAHMLTEALAPFFRLCGIPPEIAALVLIKPFSGSGSTAVLSDLLATYGPDSYIARCASVAYGSSETVFYLSAVYFAGKKKKLLRPVLIALCANFLGVVFGCFLCRFL